MIIFDNNQKHWRIHPYFQIRILKVSPRLPVLFLIHLNCFESSLLRKSVLDSLHDPTIILNMLVSQTYNKLRSEKCFECSPPESLIRKLSDKKTPFVHWCIYLIKIGGNVTDKQRIWYNNSSLQFVQEPWTPDR